MQTGPAKAKVRSWKLTATKLNLRNTSIRTKGRTLRSKNESRNRRGLGDRQGKAKKKGSKNVFRLYSDIDMEGVDWMPIGMRNGAYGGPQGTFDGQGHVIRNFRINKWLYQSGSFIKKNQQVGVFGVWYGTIKDLTIENVTVNGMDGVDGLTISEYYNSSYGARKGMAGT